VFAASGGRGEKLYLISMIDDATCELTAGFVRHDSSEENLRQLRGYVERHGRPLAVSTDKASLFQVTPRAMAAATVLSVARLLMAAFLPLRG